jgi:hypothetical protein
VSVCGAISHYNEKGEYSKVVDILPLCVFKVGLHYQPQNKVACSAEIELSGLPNNVFMHRRRILCTLQMSLDF